MRRNRLAAAVVAGAMLLAGASAGAESKREYENRFRLMLDLAVRMNEYVRQHLGDRSLGDYAQRIAEKNARAAEKMTPPEQFELLHPHFLLVLENIERGFHYASEGRLDRYRHHQKVVRKELHVLEMMAEREGLGLYLWDRGF